MLERIEKARKAIAGACRKVDKPIQVMEVCGTHTVAIFRHGIRSLLPKNLKLLSGPGCPVCVTDQGYIDVILELAQRDDVILATYGDMMRVPGKAGSLESLHRSTIKVVLSTDDALTLAQKHPDKIVVFAAVGFETTTPPSAVAVADAAKEGVKNFCILSGHKLVVPAMQALLGAKNDKIDAFLCPGHVSVILGSDAYKPVVEQFKRPCVVAGFEAVQILEGLANICEQVAEGTARVDSIYGAAVTPQGNATARKIIAEAFEPCDGAWRGLGVIPGATLRLKEKYSRFDALKRFGMEEIPAEELGGCQCGRVLCGLIDPPQCPLFGRTCTPDAPIGPCMVSTEGACSAWYKYGK
ncbi:MAG: hydrogenase formation protein HypD [Planctomycetales bacterium]|nr:hydrogenase formation protein HypD [Planctomycetales bacterium]